MYKHILIPTDGSELSMKAAREAIRLAREHGAKATALYVIPRYVAPGGIERAYHVSEVIEREYLERHREYARKVVREVIDEARAQGVECDAMAPVRPTPWEGIVEAARELGCDLIVMASHARRGIERLLLGSETNKVLTHTRTPVLVCR